MSEGSCVSIAFNVPDSLSSESQLLVLIEYAIRDFKSRNDCLTMIEYKDAVARILELHLSRVRGGFYS